MLILLLLIIAVGAIVAYWNNTKQNEAILERLLYDQDEVVAEKDQDLTDPAYGLRGMEKRKFQAFHFVSTLKGKAISAVGAASIGFLVSSIAGVDAASKTGFSIATAGLTFLGIFFVLTKVRKSRHRIIRRELPNALELLSAMMKGGIAFDSALKHVVRESDGRDLVYKELGLISEAMSRGRRRVDAFKLFASRCDQDEVSDLVTGLIQADQTGGSLADVMRHHSAAMFREYEAEVQERAEKLPVKMMIPMILTIFPALLIVLLAPNFLRIIKVLTAMVSAQSGT